MEVRGYSNYLIYEDGRVYSKGSKFNAPRFLKPYLRKNGYYVVCLRDGMGGGKPHFIHRLLGVAYIDNEENKPFIDHIDRNRQNNCLENLRWATSKENNNNKTDRVVNKNSTTGHKRIHATATGFRYLNQTKEKKMRKRFATLEEALEFKAEYES
tara:strand:+ start:86 stop:550 length:465 start_codon:yes stop_codon:yes gene_type:complete